MQIKSNEGKTIIPIPSLRRLPLYHQYLKEKIKNGVEYVSATNISDDLDLIAIQVRKDIAYTGITGKPKLGYDTKELLKVIEHFLGWDDVKKAFLIGAGNLGLAIMGYPGFKELGLDIVCAFDIDPAKIGKEYNGIKILNLDKFEDLTKRMKIKIGILTVPLEAAQTTADRMVKAGIKAIWNFSSTKLVVPEGIIVQSENLATSLTVLSKKLSIQLNKGGQNE
jgi:redox-sensing transcriptional repressor